MTLRVARLLLYLESGLLLLAGIFAVAIGLLLGGNSIPFAGAEVSGVGAAALGVFYAALGAAAFYMSVELGRLTPWSRTGAIVVQAVLIVLFLARGDFSASLAISLALCLGVVALLFTPSATAALTRTPAATRPTVSPTTPATPAGAPSPSGRR